ncbi:hypothetical protein PILCRDRAFT_13757 [Piloderma croceum F 1598]|uniref:Uncharacterized protein n=1 Tax=Piloderma croceum (strain F 1598) TaxID=765440 RepID=A0A0C3BD38_PILCF|nr:hypothetical protein PILCRDRAFT_13757 [Piloderma croceum F 1598]
MRSQRNQTTRKDTSERREHSRSSVTHPKTPTTHLQDLHPAKDGIMILECEGCGECDCNTPGPECTGSMFKIVWRDENIGQCVLFRTVPGGKHYVAKIISRNGQNANLVWHPHNVYSDGEAPALPTLTRAARECSEALEYAGLNAVSDVSLC